MPIRQDNLQTAFPVLITLQLREIGDTADLCIRIEVLSLLLSLSCIASGPAPVLK